MYVNVWYAGAVRRKASKVKRAQGRAQSVTSRNLAKGNVPAFIDQILYQKDKRSDDRTAKALGGGTGRPEREQQTKRQSITYYSYYFRTGPVFLWKREKNAPFISD